MFLTITRPADPRISITPAGIAGLTTIGNPKIVSGGLRGGLGDFNVIGQ
jgi:hypothetical protein